MGAMSIGYVLAAFAAVLPLCSQARGSITTKAETNDVVRLRGTVLETATLRTYKGTFNPVGDVDPRFALKLRVESCAPALTNLKAGTVVTLAMHSPSLFLGGSAEKGKSYEITMSRKKAANLFADDPVERARPTGVSNAKTAIAP